MFVQIPLMFQGSLLVIAENLLEDISRYHCRTIPLVYAFKCVSVLVHALNFT